MFLPYAVLILLFSCNIKMQNWIDVGAIVLWVKICIFHKHSFDCKRTVYSNGDLASTNIPIWTLKLIAASTCCSCFNIICQNGELVIGLIHSSPPFTPFANTIQFNSIELNSIEEDFLISEPRWGIYIFIHHNNINIMKGTLFSHCFKIKKWIV